MNASQARARLAQERARITAPRAVRPPADVTWRPTPTPIEANRLASGQLTMQKIWDLSPIQADQSPDPTEPPGVIPDPPTNTVIPFITPLSDLSVGAQLVLSVGTWTGGPTYGRQWTHNDAPIAGETGVGYIISADFIGENIGATVTASNAGGSASADAAEVGPVTEASPLAQ